MTRLQSIEHGSGDFFHRDAVQALVVAEGALAFEAGAARDVVTEDAMAAAGGAGEARLGAAEEGDDGHAEGGGEVHGASVVGEEELAGSEFGDEFGEAGFANEVGVRGGG